MEALGALLIVVGIVVLITIWTGTTDKVIAAVFSA